LNSKWWAALASINPIWLSLTAIAGIFVGLMNHGAPTTWGAAFFILAIILQWGWIYGVHRIALYPFDTRHWLSRDWSYLLGFAFLVANVTLTLGHPRDGTWVSDLNDFVGFSFMLFAFGTASNAAGAVSDSSPRLRPALSDRTVLAIGFIAAPIGAWLLKPRLDQLRAASEVRARLRVMA
jgi:hypothetical protein